MAIARSRTIDRSYQQEQVIELDYRIKRQIGAFVGGAILALVIVLAARDAHAGGGVPQLLAQFDVVSDACLSAPLTAAGKYSPKCVERDRVARALERAGYERSRHDVWFRASDVQFLYRLALVASQVASPPDQAPAYLYGLTRHEGIDDAELFAIWQQHADEFRDASPYLWAITSELLHRIDNVHPARHNDPRFMLD